MHLPCALLSAVLCAALVVTTVAAALAAEPRRIPSTTMHEPSTTRGLGSSIATAATATPPPELMHRHLVRRAPLLATGSTEQAPPWPSSWFSPLPRPPVTRDRPPPTTTKEPDNGFGVRPSNDLGVGHAPPPRDMSPAKVDLQPGPHDIGPSALEPEAPKEKAPADPDNPSFGPPGESNRGIGVLVAPGFINIWLPSNVPQPGNPIKEDPPIPSPSNGGGDRPPAPTQPSPGGGGDGRLTGLPPPPSAATATPTFTAIPIIPPVLSSLNQTLTNATAPPPLSDPPTDARCGDGWCTVAESCVTCSKDCSVSHFNLVGVRQHNAQSKSPLHVYSNPLEPTYLTFHCAAPQFAQFCPPPNLNASSTSGAHNSSRPQSAMLAIIGSHPSSMTENLPEILAGVPPSAVAVFLDMQLLTSPSVNAIAMRRSIRVLRNTGYLVGIALGSALLQSPHALSITSVLRAHHVYAHLPHWLALPDSKPISLHAYLSVAAGSPIAAIPHGWPPLYLTTDPNSSYFHALTPAIAQLLFALDTRVVVPSLPIADHLMATTLVNAAETGVKDLATIMHLRPGVPGWIVGLDASTEAGVPVVKRVIEEVGKRAAWVQGGVRACLEYRPVEPPPQAAGDENRPVTKSVAEVVELVRRQAKPVVAGMEWKKDQEQDVVDEVNLREEEGW